MTRAASVRGDPPRLQDPHDSLSAVSLAVPGFGESVFYYSYDPAHAYLPPCVHDTPLEIAIDFGPLQWRAPLWSLLYVEREGFERAGASQARRLPLEEVRRALDALEELLQEMAPLSAEDLGRRLAATMAEIPQALAVAVAAFGRAFRIRTVIQSYDMDVCEQVYAREKRLYEVYPDLEAEFRVLTQRQTEGRLVVEGAGYDFVSTRDEW